MSLANAWSTFEAGVAELAPTVRRAGGDASELATGLRRLRRRLRACEHALEHAGDDTLVVLHASQPAETDAPAQAPANGWRQKGAASAKETISLLDDEDDDVAAAGAGAAPLPPSELCFVCFCDYTPQERRAFGCGHALCADCASTFVSGKIEEGVVGDRLRCPSISPKACTYVLTPHDCRAALGRTKEAASLLEKYETRSLEAAVAAADGLSCCPSPGCKFLFAWDKDHRKLSCPDCRNEYCLVCKGANEENTQIDPGILSRTQFRGTRACAARRAPARARMMRWQTTRAARSSRSARAARCGRRRSTAATTSRAAAAPTGAFAAAATARRRAGASACTRRERGGAARGRRAFGSTSPTWPRTATGCEREFERNGRVDGCIGVRVTRRGYHDGALRAFSKACMQHASERNVRLSAARQGDSARCGASAPVTAAGPPPARP